MSFNYQKHKDLENHGNQWTSYSDLFMGLSFVFLLLYVTASLRTGTNGIQQQIQIQRVAMENEDLKNQLKVYNSLKKDYLETEASPDEEKLYKDLMSKLDLLQDQAKSEKEKLETEAQDNAKKEMALNKYQQAIRNILNANAIAKSRIKKRNDIIEEQDEEIVVQGTKIGDLEKSVNDKKYQIAIREKQIAKMNEGLDKKMKELNWAYKHQKMTQKKYESQMAQARLDHEEKMSDLKRQQAQAQQQLHAVSSKLVATQGQLSEKEQLASNLSQKLAGTEKDLAEQGAKLRSEFEGQRARDRAAFEAEMERQKLSASDRAAKEAAYRAGVARKERELADRISGLRGQLAGTEAQLAKARAEAEARKNVAKEIQQGLSKAGVKAEVDGETGDVTIDFGDHYFETGRAEIKPEMAKILQKALPVYAKSLMENKKIADKISNVEIIGFASPTYKGRFIDPSSMDPEDKKAVEYNLDLSYQRARSIFQYVFDPSRMQFSHQKNIRPLVKVSGKSFFEAAKISRDIAAANAKDFCKKFDCKKSQRVLIKFTVDQKQ